MKALSRDLSSSNKNPCNKFLIAERPLCIYFILQLTLKAVKKEKKKPNYLLEIKSSATVSRNGRRGGWEGQPPRGTCYLLSLNTLILSLPGAALSSSPY